MKSQSFFISFILIFLFLSVGSVSQLSAQNTTITDDKKHTADPSAMLDVQSTTKGMLIPRMTTTQREKISNPADGLLVYDVTEASFYYFQNKNWLKLSSINENAGTDGVLFFVTNAANDTVFAVYNDGVKVTIPEGAKGKVGGFAVSGRSATKAKGEYEILRVTQDSTRIYVKDTSYVKGKVGGFAVSGRSATKGLNQSILLATNDSTRIYVDESTKGKVGGFAVSGRSATKRTVNKFMDLKTDNYFIGHQSGINNTTGLYNSFFGYQSGRANTTGSYNVFLGFGSGYNNSEGSNNVFLGNYSGYANTTGIRNIMIGYLSGRYNTTASNNINIGYYSGYYNSTGNFNMHLGYRSGYYTGFGTTNDPSYNTYIGYETGFYKREGEYNTFIGYQSGYGQNSTATTGEKNTAIGFSAGRNLTSGSYNVFVGDNSGYSNATGTSNIFIGQNAGYNNASGFNNIMIGRTAGYSGTAHENNIFIGDSTGFFTDNQFARKNVFIGYAAGKNTQSYNNVFIGNKAGYSNSNGQNNIAIGDLAGFKTNASQNIFIGTEAGKNNDDGYFNIMIGRYSGRANISGTMQVLIGGSAGSALTTGSENVIVGHTAGTMNETGIGNTYLGHAAGWSNTGSKNIFIGYKVGYGNFTTSSNILVVDNQSTTTPLLYGEFDNDLLKINGTLSATNQFGINTTSPSTFLHINQTNDASLTTAASGVVMIGNSNGSNMILDENEIMARASGTTATSLYLNREGGNIYIGDATSDIYLKGSLYNSSDRRLKNNIAHLNYGLNETLKFQPVSYNWKDSKNTRKQIGFIAQEVRAIAPELVTEDEEGNLGLDYTKFAPILVNSIQEQQTQIEEQQEKIDTQQAEIDALKKELEEIKKLIKNN